MRIRTFKSESNNNFERVPGSCIVNKKKKKKTDALTYQ